MVDVPLFVQSIDGVGKDRKSHDFKISLTSGIHLDPNRDHYISVNDLSMTYAWYNISLADYNNGYVRYSPDSGANWFDFTIPDSNMTYRDINDYIQNELDENGHSKTGIMISFIHTVLKVLIEFEPGFRLDLTQGRFRELIGFEPNVLSVTAYDQLPPNITMSVDEILIRSNLVSDSIVSSNESDVLLKIDVANLQLSYPFHIEGRRLLWSKLTTTLVKTFRIYITDGHNQPINLNNAPMSLTLLIRSVDR